MPREKKSEKVCYGIIGCGEAFQKHAEAIRKNMESELAAVFDIDARRTEAASTKYGCEKKTSTHAMLGDMRIDAVVICTPHDTHKDLVLRTIKAGKYAICEKPLVLSSGEGRAILKSKYYNRNVMTVFQTRFNPATRLLFHLISSGGLGKTLLCNAQVYKYRDGKYFKADWRKDRRRSGGMLFSQGIHALDIMRLVCGEPRKISAIRKNYRPHFKNIEDAYVAAVEFKNGAVGTITVSTAVQRNHREHSIFIGGSGGSMEIGGYGFEEVLHLDLKKPIERQAYSSKRTDHERFLSAVNDFILRKKLDPLLPFAEDGVLATAFIEKLHAAENKQD